MATGCTLGGAAVRLTATGAYTAATSNCGGGFSNDRSTSHSGHHLGLYGQILSYDIEFGGRGWQSDGLGWGVGLSYGYSLPVCRYFNLDFTIGLGYFGGKYKRYDPVDECYVWQKTDNLNWIGPTKAEISLVWIIGGRRKGGNL